MEICQSCGMPMLKASDFGTGKDDRKSRQYCHFCYESGKFKDEGITMEGKIAKNIEISMKMGMHEAEAKKMANSIIPKLKRWKKR